MEKEQLLLGEELGRLEIEPVKLNSTRSNDNPFIGVLQRKDCYKKQVSPPKESQCTCSIQKKVKRSGVYRKKFYKILKEPSLNILKNCHNNNNISEAEECNGENNNTSDVVGSDPLNLCILVRNCNQLSISPNVKEQNAVVRDTNDNHKWWQKEVAHSQESKEPKQQSSHSGSCSQQALNPPCDVTIDELASYFETLVHIPKKMSSMAEMMYI